MSERWRIAVHEAGHAVAAYRLGAWPGLVAITGPSTGLAVSAMDGPGWAVAVVAAAGPAAERFAAEYAAPRREPLPAARTADVATRQVAMVRAAFPPESLVDDGATIGAWAAAARDGAGRLSRLCAVHAAARLLVMLHAAQVLAVARAVFARGVVAGAELERLLTVPVAGRKDAAMGMLEALRRRAAVRRGGLGELADRIISGEDVPVDLVERELARLGETVDALEAVIAERTRTAEVAKLEAELAELTSKRTSLRAQIDAADAELQAARVRHASIVGPLLNEEGDCDAHCSRVRHELGAARRALEPLPAGVPWYRAWVKGS
ncbi:MAG: hypothetical protein IPM18_00125 [Phycisphaerales bacterium]|nr:hypothetical protein [Phycisphaerales bacterium]